MKTRYSAILAFSVPLFLGAQTQNALDFDGLNDEVTVTGASALVANATGFSMTCWVYPTQSANWPNMEGFAGFRDNATFDFYLLQTYGTTLEGRFRNSSNGLFTVDSIGVLALNTWQHLALTYDGTTLKMYRDGMNIGSVAANGTVTNQTGLFRIGNVVIPGSTQVFLDGKVDEVTLWDRGLTNAEIMCIMGYGADPSDGDLKLYYKMDQGVAGGVNTAQTTLVNAVPGYNGSVQGFAMNGATSNYVDGCAIAGTTTETICPGETVIFNGQPYSTAGTYTAAYPQANGCDSLATLTLKVTSVNVTVIQSGGNLVSQATNAQYQWLDCGNAYAQIPGATGPSYDYTMSGSYAVEVTQNGCVDTSACTSVSTIGIDEALALNDLRVRFDETQDAVVVSWNGAVAGLQVTMVDPRGRLVASVPARSGRTLVPTAGAPAGIYVVIVTDGTRQRSFRVPVIR